MTSCPVTHTIDNLCSYLRPRGRHKSFLVLRRFAPSFCSGLGMYVRHGIEKSLQMAEGTDAVPVVRSTQKRRQYTREKKLEVLKYYHENGMNKYRTAQKFGIDKKCLHRWIADEEKIEKGNAGAKRFGSGRRAFWPDVEEKLLEEFKELRSKGLEVKHWWFRTRSTQLMLELHPDVNFKFSPRWFNRFKCRVKISSERRTTKVSPHQPSELETKIHQEIRHVAEGGEGGVSLEGSTSSTIAAAANVDQTSSSLLTPLLSLPQFTFNGGGGEESTTRYSCRASLFCHE